jgi:hypothetical protein
MMLVVIVVITRHAVTGFLCFTTETRRKPRKHFYSQFLNMIVEVPCHRH